MIQGSGAVRPGYWARSVCINESLDKGSMLPLIHAAKDKNMGVIVFNPNQGGGSHSEQMWRKYVSPSRFNDLYIVAHSAGGSCLSSIQRNFAHEFYKRVSKVALTDSWAIGKESLNKE